MRNPKMYSKPTFGIFSTSHINYADMSQLVEVVRNLITIIERLKACHCSAHSVWLDVSDRR